jgi:hypothetical protein
MLRAALVGLMAIGSLALWIGVPVAWLLLTRGLEQGPRFVVTIAGCVVTMAAVGWLLFRLEDVYARAAGIEGEDEPPPPSWERRVGEQRARRPLTMLERILVGSAFAAVVALIVWWAFFADASNPSGPLQPL